MAGERFNREAGKPLLAEAPLADSAVETEIDPAELLTRLERQAAESGRLEGRVQTLERALKAERDARRRLAERLKRERSAAAAIHERAQRDAAALASAAEELERLRQVIAVSEQQVQVSWTRLLEAEQQLASKQRSLWRKLLRRPPTE
jgi:hypothetical protein